MTGLCDVGALAVASGVCWGLGRAGAAVLSWAWRTMYGPERTARARQWTLLPLGAVFTLTWFTALSAHGTPGTDLGSALGPGPVLLLCGPLFVGLWQGLRPSELADPAVPAGLVRDHDSVRVVLGSRSAWPAALLFGGSLLALPFLAAWPAVVFGVALWRVWSPPQTAVRVRSGVVEVGEGGDRRILPLRGLQVAQEVRWDGTPMVRLSSGDQEVRIRVGGHDPAEVTWLVRALEAAAEAAPALVEAEVPSSLRGILDAAPGGSAGGASRAGASADGRTDGR